MMTLSLSRHALSVCVAATLLTACSGSQQLAGGTGALPQTAIAPSISAEAKREKLVYISANNLMSVYKYKDGTYLGSWGTATPSTLGGECADGAGDVFVTSTDKVQSMVVEFAHGAVRPFKTLSDPSGYAVECSVDPVSGNLAVVNGRTGAVAIYTDASGSPRTIIDPQLKFAFAGYDGSGNLFVDGTTRPGRFGFAELPQGGNSFEAIELSQSIGYPGSVQWDGKHITVEDSHTSVIYRFAIHGMRTRKIGSTPLSPSIAFAQTWIFGSRVIGIGVDSCEVNGNVSCHGPAPIYDYPAGGLQVKYLGGRYAPYTDPTGITVSLP